MFERQGNVVDLPEDLRQEIAAEAKEYARQMRTRLGVDPTATIDIIPLLENQGVLVFQVVELGASGFVRVIGERKAIFLNASEPLGRQYFTAAHEYAHILRHLELVKQFGGISEEQQQLEEKKMEYFAHAFADQFLMTTEAVESCLQKYGLTHDSAFTLLDIFCIQHHFRVSFRQTTRRLNKEGYISNEKRDELNQVSSKDDPQRLIRETEQAGFTTDLVLPLKQGKIPAVYYNSLISNIQAGLLTERKIRHLQEVLGIPDLLQFIEEVGREE